MTALWFSTIFFHFYTPYVYLLLSFPCCALVLLVVSGLLGQVSLRLGVVSGFEGFLLPPCVLCGLGVFLWGRVKGFGMGILVV